MAKTSVATQKDALWCLNLSLRFMILYSLFCEARSVVALRPSLSPCVK
jgi:hypothetical protein